MAWPSLKTSAETKGTKGHSPHPHPLLTLCCGSRWCQRGTLSGDSRLSSPPATYSHSSPQAHLPAPLPPVLGGAPEFPPKCPPPPHPPLDAGQEAGGIAAEARGGGALQKPGMCRTETSPSPHLIPAAQGGVAAARPPQEVKTLPLGKPEETNLVSTTARPSLIQHAPGLGLFFFCFPQVGNKDSPKSWVPAATSQDAVATG